MVRSNLYLDNKNKKVLVKAVRGQKLTTQDQKRLYRTNVIIQRATHKVQANKKYENVVNQLFF